MSVKQLTYEERSGNKQIHETDKFVIRLREDEKEVVIMIHEKHSNGNEGLPNGYVLGSNMLIYRKR